MSGDQKNRFSLWESVVRWYGEVASRQDHQLYRPVVIAFIVVANLVILRCAWMCDDSFITLRVIDNWIQGFGLRWNPLERVQVATCPLWIFVLTPFVALTNEFYFTVVFISFSVTCAALVVTATRVLGGRGWSVAFLAVFILSRTLVDFSTSGMETPLSYLVLSGFILALVRALNVAPDENHRHVVLTFGMAALAMLNRLDNLWIVAPGLVLVLSRGPFSLRHMGGAILGLSPIIIWEMFSLLYYGSLLPNTAYAKLNTGIPSSLYCEQGFYYLGNLMRFDLLASFVIVVGVGMGLASWRKSKAAFCLAVGMILHVIYIVSVGGDHMSGRFLAPAAFVGLTILFLSKAPSTFVRAALTFLMLVIGFTGKTPPLLVGGDYFERKIDRAGIADLRSYFSNELSLVNQGRIHRLRNTPWARSGVEARLQGRHTVVERMIGCFGLFAGPEVHIVDPLALSDPLLARLPSHPRDWRAGHYERLIPPGYEQSILGENQIRDPYLRAYYDHLKVILRGSLFAPERLLAIWKMNTGGFDHLLDAYLRTMDRSVPYQSASLFKSPEGDFWNNDEHHTFSRTGIVVQAPAGRAPNPRYRSRQLEVSLRGGHSYKLEFWRWGRKTGDLSLNLKDRPGDFMTVRRLEVPARAIRMGYDRVFIAAESSRRLAALGHLRSSPFEVRMSAADTAPKPQASVSKDPGVAKPPPPGPVHWFGGKSLVVELDKTRFAPSLTAALSGDDAFYYEVRRNGETVFKSAIPKTDKGGQATERTLRIPLRIAERGYDELVLDPTAGQAPSALRHVVLGNGNASHAGSKR